MNRTANTSATRAASAAAIPAAVLVVAGVMPFLAGCAAIGDIFKAGVGVGIFVVVAILALIGGAAMMFSKK